MLQPEQLLAFSARSFVGKGFETVHSCFEAEEKELGPLEADKAGLLAGEMLAAGSSSSSVSKLSHFE